MIKTDFSHKMFDSETDFMRSFIYEGSSKFTHDENLRSQIVEIAVGIASENIEECMSSSTEAFLDDILHRAATTVLTLHAARYENENSNKPQLTLKISTFRR